MAPHEHISAQYFFYSPPTRTQAAIPSDGTRISHLAPWRSPLIDLYRAVDRFLAEHLDGRPEGHAA